MKNFLRLLIPCLVVLIITGAGCVLGGSKKVDTSKSGGIYKSVDFGATWNQTSAYPTAKTVGNIGTASIKNIVFDPQDHTVIYLGTTENGLLFSYDSGASWQSPKDINLQTGTVSSIAVDPKNICTVYAAMGTRLYKTKTCGREFTSVYDETREKTFVRQIVADWYNEGVVYLSISNGDILKSIDSGESWSNVRAGRGDVADILINNLDSRAILVGANGSLWKSSDGGLTWVDMSETLKEFKDGLVFYKLVQDKNSSTVYAATRYGLLKSLDFGDTWQAAKMLTSPRQVEIKALVIDPTDSNKVYYSTSTTFYKSVDAGLKWDTQKITPETWGVSYLAIDPKEPGTIYMGREKIEK